MTFNILAPSLFLFTFFYIGIGWGQSIKKNKPVMDTTASVQLAAEQAAVFPELWKIADGVHKMLSRSEPDSELSQINRNRTAEVSVKLIQLIRRGLILHEATGGYFNCTLGTLKEDPLPGKEAIKKGPSELISINEKTVSLNSPDVLLDLERLKEATAVDAMIDYLMETGVREGIVQVGNTVRCLGDCKLEINNPFAPTEKWSILQSKRGDLAVSSFNFQKKYLQEAEEQTVIDPKTGGKVETFAGVTILTTADSVRASAFAAAVSAMPEKDIVAALKKYPDMAFILVYKSGEVRTSANIYEFLNSVKFAPESWVTDVR